MGAGTCFERQFQEAQMKEWGKKGGEIDKSMPVSRSPLRPAGAPFHSRSPEVLYGAYLRILPFLQEMRDKVNPPSPSPTENFLRRH